MEMTQKTAATLTASIVKRRKGKLKVAKLSKFRSCSTIKLTKLPKIIINLTAMH